MATPFAARGPIGFVASVLAGSVSAAAFAVGLNHVGQILFFAIYLTAIPLFAAGLGAGLASGAVACAAGVATLLLGKLTGYAAMYTVIFVIPVIVLTGLCLRSKLDPKAGVRWTSEGETLTAAVIYPCVLFLVAAGAAWNYPGGGLLGATQKYMDQGAAAFKSQVPADLMPQFNYMVDLVIHYMPAIFGATWLLLVLISLLIAQNALEQQKWQLRPSFELQKLYLPDGLMYAVAVTGLIGVAAPAPWNYIGCNLGMLLGLPFVFAGLAIMHAWAATTRWPTALLVLFYIILSVMPMLGILVTLMGAIDQWANFRKYFKTPTKSNLS